MADHVSIVLAGETVILHPQRALIWPAQHTLFIADLHLGKGEVFRRSGIPIPEGATATDLERLDELVATHGLQRIVLLGDFVHAAATATSDYTRVFTRWRASRQQVEFVVIAGNHDRRAAGRELVDSVRWHLDDWLVGPFLCRHHPATSPLGFVLSGHIHPVVRLYGNHRERARVPVCWVREGCAVLPSFGSFTGGGDIEPEPDDELYAFAANRVWRIPR